MSEVLASPSPTVCRDAYTGRPGCLVDSDPSFTMNFDDIGEGSIFWCSSCGKEAAAMSAALDKALHERGPAWAEHFRAQVEIAEAIETTGKVIT